MSSAVMSRDESFLGWLIERGRLTSAVAERISRVQAETSDRLAAVLLKLGLLSEADLADQLALYTGEPRLLLSELPGESVDIPEFNEEFARSHGVHKPLNVQQTDLCH